MKKTRLILTLAWLLPAAVFAQGDHIPGYVYIAPNNNFMYGTFNNRYDNTPTAFKSYIGAGGYAGGLLYFYGQDVNGRYFYCYVPTSSSIYPAAVEIKNSLGNGSLLSVQQESRSNECASVYSAKASHYLD